DLGRENRDGSFAVQDVLQGGGLSSGVFPAARPATLLSGCDSAEGGEVPQALSRQTQRQLITRTTLFRLVAPLIISICRRLTPSQSASTSTTASLARPSSGGAVT